MTKQQSVFCEKIVKQKGITKIELQCWLQIEKQFNSVEYQRYISKFQKFIKETIYNLKNENSDNYQYFVDVNIRDSPSKTAFLSLEISLFKNNLINQLPKYTERLKSVIQNYPHISVFYNDKKRKK